MHRGYLKLWRKIKEWEWYKNSETLHLFLHLMINANYKTSRYMGHDILRGQAICGRKELSEKTGISEQSIRTSIERLKSTNEITTKSTNKFTIITLCNFETYQNDINEINQQTNQLHNQQLTSNQPATNHIQESKEYKKEKNNTKTWRSSFWIYRKIVIMAYREIVNNPETMKQQAFLNPTKDVFSTIQKAVINYWGTPAGWKNKKSKRINDIDMKRTLINSISQPCNAVYLPRDKTGPTFSDTYHAEALLQKKREEIAHQREIERLKREARE